MAGPLPELIDALGPTPSRDALLAVGRVIQRMRVRHARARLDAHPGVWFFYPLEWPDGDVQRSTTQVDAALLPKGPLTAKAMRRWVAQKSMRSTITPGAFAPGLFPSSALIRDTFRGNVNFPEHTYRDEHPTFEPSNDQHHAWHGGEATKDEAAGAMRYVLSFMHRNTTMPTLHDAVRDGRVPDLVTRPPEMRCAARVVSADVRDLEARVATHGDLWRRALEPTSVYGDPQVQALRDDFVDGRAPVIAYALALRLYRPTSPVADDAPHGTRRNADATWHTNTTQRARRSEPPSDGAGDTIDAVSDMPESDTDAVVRELLDRPWDDLSLSALRNYWNELSHWFNQPIAPHLKVAVAERLNAVDREGPGILKDPPTNGWSNGQLLERKSVLDRLRQRLLMDLPTGFDGAPPVPEDVITAIRAHLEDVDAQQFQIALLLPTPDRSPVLTPDAADFFNPFAEDAMGYHRPRRRRPIRDWWRRVVGLE